MNDFFAITLTGFGAIAMTVILWAIVYKINQRYDVSHAEDRK